jgi:hypothetical protein
MVLIWKSMHSRDTTRSLPRFTQPLLTRLTGGPAAGRWRAAGDVQDEAAAIPARQARGVA